MKKTLTSVKNQLFAFVLLLFVSNTNAQTVIQIGTGTTSITGSSTSTAAVNASPYGICVGSSSMGKKLQIIYTAAQINAALTAAGLSTGAPYTISTAAWDVSTNVGTGNPNMLSYTIKMANVSETSFTGTTANAASMSTVFSQNSQWAGSGTGYITTLTLASTFQWDGSSSLLVEVCYTVTGVGTITAYGGCRRTTTASTQMIYNGGASITCGTSSYVTAVAAIPNMRVTVVAATPCSGTPAIGTVSSPTPCAGTSSTLTISGVAGASGYTYQWLQSDVIGGTYTNATGTSTNSTYATPTTLPYTTTYYKCDVTCSNSSQTTRANAGTVTNANFLTCYCTGTYAAANGGTRGITNVAIGSPASPTISNSSAVVNGGAGATSYTLYTAAAPVANAGLTLSVNYNLAVTVGSQSTAVNNVGAWIDYNQNGVYETTEFLGSFTNAAASSTTNINFTVSASATPGTTNMRVRHRYGAAVSSSDACTNFTGTAGAGGAGETEDYRVLIVAGCSAPATSASGFSSANVLTTTADISFTRGDGSGGVLVLARATGAVNTSPTSGNGYTANAAFGSGSQIGTGNYVVYNGTASPTVNLSLSNLTSNTAYHFAIYEFDATGPCYKLTSVLTGNFTTLICVPPSVQALAGSPTLGATGNDSQVLNWDNNGNADGVIIVAKQGGAPTAPTLQSSYTANTTFGLGSTTAALSYVLYKGNATTTTISGLTPNTSYSYSIYTYTSATNCYNLTSPVAGSFSTNACHPTTQASAAVIACFDYNSITLSFNRGSGTRVLVLAKSGSAVNANPVYGTTYTANEAFGSGTQIGTGNYVVYDGNASGTVTTTVTGLTAGTTYHFAVYEYNESPNCYNVTSPAIISRATRNAATYTSSTTAQISTTVAQNTLAAQVINLQVVVGGGQDPAATMNSITFNTSGTTNTADITNARIFYTGTSSTFSTATQFGSSVTSFSGNLTATGNFALATGTNYFWIAYDVNVAATISNVLDATIVSFNMTDNSGTSDKTPSTTAPAGSRSIIASGPSGYCTPAHNQTVGDCIRSVAFAGTSYTGGDNCNTGSAAYQNFTALAGPTVTPGSTYTLTYYADDFIGNTNSCWIDWNQSGSFDASGSEAITIDHSSFSVTLSVTVPVGATPGATRLRIANRFPSAGSNACTGSNGSSTSGLTSDFTIIVSGGGGSQNVACASVAPTVTTPVNYAYGATASSLSATGTSLLWYTAVTGGTGSGTAPTPATSAPGTTTYYVSQNTAGCEGPRTQIVSVVGPQICCIAPASPSVGSNSPACTGGNINLTSSAATGTGLSYAWSGPNRFTSTSQNPTISSASALMAGTYTVTITNGCGSVTATTSVSVNEAPSVPTAGSNSPVCTGGSLTLSSGAEAGTDPFNYAWTGPNGYTSISPNPTVSTIATTGMSGTYSVTISNSCGSVSATTSVSVTTCALNFTVKLFLQGYYIGGSSMSPLLHLLYPATHPGNDVDTVIIELHDSNSPYSTLYSYTGIVVANGTITCSFTGAAAGNYYIVVKHRNSLETWSSVQSVTSSMTFDFTSGAGQSYNSNSRVSLGGGVFGIYGGDIDGNGSVDATDKSSLQSVLSSFHAGVYNINDLTGDGFVDEDDLRVLQNNVPSGVSASHP